MYFDQHQPDDGIKLDFEGLEVDTVREAYKEHNAHLRSLGNESSVLPYHDTIATWHGNEHAYLASSESQIVEKLRYLVEATDDRVDEILGESPASLAYEEAGRRYELGQCAARLLGSIELQRVMEQDWKEVLEDRDQT